MRLLLVDDEVLAIDGLKENLLTLPWAFEEIFVASSKSQAQDVLRHHCIDMMICDIEMPGGNGLELLAWVKEEYPRMLTVVLSCHDEFTFAQQAVRLTCFDYILKPATPEVLYPVIKRAMALQKEQQQGERIRKLGENYLHQLSDQVAERENVAEKIRQYLALHITEEISIEQLSQVFYLSPDYLTRCFKKRYGMPISEFVMDLRLSLAAEMLEKKEMSVTMIAAKVGYPNYTYFTKIFKKKYGVPPVKYRKDQI